MKKIISVLSLLLFLFSYAQRDTVFVYGPGGPAPAIKEIASQYNKQAASFLKVTAGPTPQWKNQAMQNAHVIYSGSRTHDDRLCTNDDAKRVADAYGLPFI